MDEGTHFVKVLNGVARWGRWCFSSPTQGALRDLGLCDQNAVGVIGRERKGSTTPSFVARCAVHFAGCRSSAADASGRSGPLFLDRRGKPPESGGLCILARRARRSGAWYDLRWAEPPSSAWRP